MSQWKQVVPLNVMVELRSSQVQQSTGFQQLVLRNLGSLVMMLWNPNLGEWMQVCQEFLSTTKGSLGMKPCTQVKTTPVWSLWSQGSV